MAKVENARAEHAGKEAKQAETKAKKAAKEAAKEAKNVKRTPLHAEEATAGKVQRGRKRKSATEGAHALGPRAKIARISNTQAVKADRMRVPWSQMLQIRGRAK
jgi:hypothetical protein